MTLYDIIIRLSRVRIGLLLAHLNCQQSENHVPEFTNINNLIRILVVMAFIRHLGQLTPPEIGVFACEYLCTEAGRTTSRGVVTITERDTAVFVHHLPLHLFLCLLFRYLAS
jgi:hypothetical protein